MKHNTSPAPLVKLRKQLDKYRGVGIRAVFPEHLKQQAVSLLEEFSPTTVQRELRVSPTSLSRWRNQIHASSNTTALNGSSRNDIGSFISLPAVQQIDSPKHPLSIVLGCADSDNRISMKGQVTLQQWQEILRLITKVLLP